MRRLIGRARPEGGTTTPRRGPTARTRIVAWFLLVVTSALAISLLIVGQVLLERAASRAAIEITHEGTKLRAYAAEVGDPLSPRAVQTADALLTGFLREVLPDSNETFFSVIDGAAAHRSASMPHARLDLDATVVAWAAAAAVPQSRTFATPAGPALVAVFPVDFASDPSRAALVVVEFLGPGRAEAWSVIRLIAMISAGALAVAAVASYLVAGRVLRPIRQVRLAAEALTETDLSRRIQVSGTDDVAQLARTFNGMLDRIETAFTAQRDFLDDAGHELRTPLTIIRGHLELMGDDPAERAQTTALLLDEIDRMRRLVDDLIVLAQLRQPDFLQPGPVDLADVVVDVVSKTSAMAPRAWRIDAVADARITADGQRLTQALMQLCSNAVAHTESGDVIAVGSSMTPRLVRLWVRDTGSGVDPADAEKIFTRAIRGHAATAGSGLGLAIVSSIAKAHGGRVTLESNLGQGATFTIELPRRLAATGDSSL